MSTTGKVTVHTEPADTIWHGAALPYTATAIVGPAVGSQEDKGPLADVTIEHDRGYSYGFTFDDPDLLDEMATVLWEAAQALRAARTAAGK